MQQVFKPAVFLFAKGIICLAKSSFDCCVKINK